MEKEPLAVDFSDPFINAAFEKKGVQTTGEGYLALLEARKIKLPEEIQSLGNVCTISDSMFEAARSNLRPGVSEDEILGEVKFRESVRCW